MHTGADQLNAMSKKYIFTNIGKSMLCLNPMPGHQKPIIQLQPGEEVTLTGMEYSTFYSHSVKVFRDCVPKHLEMRELGEPAPVVQSQAPSGDGAETNPESPEGATETPPADEPVVVEDRAEQIKVLSAEIKELETEFKGGESSSERKQQIKKEILDRKKARNALK